MKPWFSYKTRRRSSYASRILISKTGMASWDNSGQNEAQIFEIRQKLSEREQKKALSLYFRADINNSPTHHFNENCLTISNFSNSDKCTSIGVVFKVRNQKLAFVWAIFVGF